MKLRLLPVLAVALSVLLQLIEIALRDSSSHAVFLRVENELVKAIAMVGAVIAALTYRRGDYMRRAWWFIGACMFLLLVRDHVGLFVQPSATWKLISGGFASLANLSQVVGTVILARAWWVSGLSLPGSRGAQIIIAVLLGSLALAAGGPSVAGNVSDVLGGDTGAIRHAASSVGDLVVFLLLSPVLLTAVALRGGSLAWPWALLTASSLCWMAFDAWLVLGPLLDASPAALTSGTELMRALACTLGGAAGLAQRWVIVGMRDQLAQPSLAA